MCREQRFNAIGRRVFERKFLTNENVMKTTTICLIVFASILSVCRTFHVRADRPNVILIYTDDHGYTDLGLLGELDTLEISDNTYVVFTTVNGGRGTVPDGDPKSLAVNAPLSGAKHSLFEGGIRVPLMVRGPSIKSGSVCRVPVAGYDFLPTFHELAGGKCKLSDELDGGSFVTLFSDPKTDSVNCPIDGLVFSRPRQGMAVIRTGQWKLLAEVNAKR